VPKLGSPRDQADLQVERDFGTPQGVDGSSPSEGSAKAPENGACSFGLTCTIDSVQRVWSPLWSLQIEKCLASGAKRATLPHEVASAATAFVRDRRSGRAGGRGFASRRSRLCIGVGATGKPPPSGSPLLWDTLGMAGSGRWRKGCAPLPAESADGLAGASPPKREQGCRGREEHGDERCEGADTGVEPVEGAVVADLSEL
jgi:hypothetical protein